jgi:hypothetical protein
MYCKECGAKINDKAFVCPKCGVKTKQNEIASTAPKSKGTAIALAVLLGYWTWCYTYKRDAGKFWLGLGISLIGMFMLFLPNVVVWIVSMVDTISKSDEWYQNY